MRFIAPLLALFLIPGVSGDDWQEVYLQKFNTLPAGTMTASSLLPEWEAGSASGKVFDGMTSEAGSFLVASAAWTSFNQGPILNLDLTAVPHDRVRVELDLYTFGEWRGAQSATGGPQHRIMFFDSKSEPGFSFDTCFATNGEFRQAWPKQNPARSRAGVGAVAVEVDRTGRYADAHRWPVRFEYPGRSSALRFTILCGAAAGSGRGMPEFGIDNVRVSVRSTAPRISEENHPEDQRLARANPAAVSPAHVQFTLPNSDRVSLAVFQGQHLVRTLLNAESLPPGSHRIPWDGRDNRGRPATPGNYEWRLIRSKGLTARYITTIGVNPPGGEDPVPSKSWVGDHLGAGLVAVDESGIYVGSPMTEGGRMVLKCDPEMQNMHWSRPQFYQSGRLTRIATSGRHLFMVHPNGRLRRVNRLTGQVETEWQVGIDGEAPSDMDAHGDNLVVVYAQSGLIRWLSPGSGTVVAEQTLKAASRVAAASAEQGGRIYVATESRICDVTPRRIRPQNGIKGVISAMDYDPLRSELWLAVDGHRVLRLNSQLKIEQEYGHRPRPWGTYLPELFAGINDIASDRQGGFFAAEPSRAPRRLVHIARDGSPVDEWFGGMSFYISGCFDPADETRLIGLAPEGAVNIYRIDYTTGEWTIEACYQTGRLADSMFPFTGTYRAIRKNGELFLYHRHIPGVIKLDPKSGTAIPVAMAGSVRNSGRSMIQFSGTGRDGYPAPWVAAAEHHGFSDLSLAPRFFSWADSNGNGVPDPQEFHFYPGVTRGPRGVGDFFSNGDFLGPDDLNRPNAFVRVPVTGWEGPTKTAPRWDLSRQQSAGEIDAESHGFGSVRGVSIGANGSVSATYQAGVMIRDHGQYEGGGWPELAVRGCRLLKFTPQFGPQFSVGRQSKAADEVNSGVIYYPMQVTHGPNQSIVVNDQTKHPAQVWTHDGLYIGGVMDRRAEDGRPDGFYSLHGDDNQGCTLLTTGNGRTFWLMPYQGHNRLYEITGWDTWKRKAGTIRLSVRTPDQPAGTGLNARYQHGGNTVLETVEGPIYYERFGAERHTGTVQPHFKAEWTGFIVPEFSDRYRFHTLTGKGEQVAMWVDGILVHANGAPLTARNRSFDLTAGHRHRIRIEYINPNGRAELNVMWSGRVTDHQRLPDRVLHPR